MNIQETLNEGLRREFTVTITADDLNARLDKVLEDFRKTTVIKGFRKGKAPLSLLRRMHGERAMGQVVSETVQETSQELLEEKKVKPALQPEIDLVGDFKAGTDLTYSLKVDVLPDINVTDFESPSLERWVAAVEDSQIEEALGRLSEGRKSFKKAAKTYKAKQGDAVLIDYLGRVGGEAFDGGAADDHELELGSGGFIPGFEDQLIGTKAEDTKDVTVTFPSDYHAAELAGKEAVFSVTVKEVRKPAAVVVDDEFAKSLGMDDVDALKNAIKGQLETGNQSLSRAHLKRRLLDALADQYNFDVPSKMVDMEYQQIWEQIKRDSIMSGENKPEDFEGKDGPEGDDAKEFRHIAERRVRLGLLLSEIGTVNGIQVTQDEINRKVIEEARKYTGQEQQVFEFYQKNEEARAQLRAPIFEEKVVDYIVEKAEISEKTVSFAELESALRALDDEEETPQKASKPAAAKKTKKRAKDTDPATKESSDKEDSKPSTDKKTAEKKAPAKKAKSKK